MGIPQKAKNSPLLVMASVVIPVYRNSLKEDEIISLLSIRKSIPASTICFITPESLNIDNIIHPEERHEKFCDECFEGIEGYNKLMTSSRFYERFEENEFILLCQLDCLVFRDELKHWASKGYDYIAAPWFKRFVEDPSAGLWRVGNGGFSLRKVASHLRVLKQKVISGAIYPRHGNSPWIPSVAASELGLYQKIVPWYRAWNPFSTWTTVEQELRRYPRNEDLFWSLEAPKFDPCFKIAPATEALPFAFEMAPRWCFERNKKRLPFGCHAWGRYDRLFWEQILTVQEST